MVPINTMPTAKDAIVFTVVLPAVGIFACAGVVSVDLCTGCDSAIAANPADESKQNEKKKEREIDPMDVMLGVEESRFQSRDDSICERVARTREFDRWVRDYTGGNLEAAAKDWSDVLHLLKKSGAHDCSHLNGLANARTIMLDSKANGHQLWQHLYDATHHSLGDHDWYTAICLKFLAMQAEGAKDFARATNYRKRQAAILQEVTGKTSAETIEANKFVEQDAAALAAHKPK